MASGCSGGANVVRSDATGTSGLKKSSGFSRTPGGSGSDGSAGVRAAGLSPFSEVARTERCWRIALRSSERSLPRRRKIRNGSSSNRRPSWSLTDARWAQYPDASQVHALFSSAALCGSRVRPVPANAVSMSLGMLPDSRLAAKLARPAIARSARRQTAGDSGWSRIVTS